MQISVIRTFPGRSPSVEVDEYVPVRVRAHEDVLGVRYLRLGNLRTSLLEILLDPTSMSVCGLTLTCFDKIHDPRTIGELPVVKGSPVLDIKDAAFAGSPGAQRIDRVEPFSVAFGTDFLELDFGHLAEATQQIKDGIVEFYTKDGKLVGLRITGLASSDLKVIKSQNLQIT